MLYQISKTISLERNNPTRDIHIVNTKGQLSHNTTIVMNNELKVGIEQLLHGYGFIVAEKG
jgi:hypothetical protein